MFRVVLSIVCSVTEQADWACGTADGHHHSDHPTTQYADNHLHQRHLVQPSSLDKRWIKLQKEYGQFLVNFVSMLDRHPDSSSHQLHLDKLMLQKFTRNPNMEERAFKAHTMDNMRVRRMCDEFLTLEHTSWQSYSHDEIKKDMLWMPTLRARRDVRINSIRLSNSPAVTIGGYFMLAQMLGYTQTLMALDLSHSHLSAADARVLAVGVIKNKSLQDLRLSDNEIGCSGATAVADVLRANRSLMFLDLRSNKIRGLGVCELADAMRGNSRLTELDLRWNFSGDNSDYMQDAFLSLDRFCCRNLNSAIHAYARELAVAHPGDYKSIRSSYQHPFWGQMCEASSNSSTYEDVDYDTRRRESNLMCRYSVKVSVAKGHNLPQVLWTSKKHDVLGMPQPYCSFTLNGETVKTRTLQKSWNPVWNTTFTMRFHHLWQVCRLCPTCLLVFVARSSSFFLTLCVCGIPRLQ